MLCRPVALLAAPELLWGAAVVVVAGIVCSECGAVLGTFGDVVQLAVHGRGDSAHRGAHACSDGAHGAVQGVPEEDVCVCALVQSSEIKVSVERVYLPRVICLFISL